MDNKKFFKTYYSLPDRRDRVDVVIERGYRNIAVLFNGKEVALFASAGMLLKTQEIVTPDNRLIHVRFLKDSTDFEVFLDSIQIDNSETSPGKVVANLKLPIYISLTWYSIVVVFSVFQFGMLYSYVAYDPLSLVTDPAIIYMITSTWLVIIFLIISLIWLNKGSAALYLASLVVVAADLVFGSLYQLAAILFVPGGAKFLLFFAFLIPFLFKFAAVSSFLRNWKKFKQFAHMRDLENRKSNPELVDL